MRRMTIATGVLACLGAVGGPVAPGAQPRVVVPIVVQPARPAPATPARTAVEVTTRTVSPRPGVTTTRVTVRDTTGIQGFASGRSTPLRPGETRVTVRDTTGVQGFASGRSGVSPSGAVTTHVTVRDTTGVQGFASGGPSPSRPGMTTSHAGMSRPQPALDGEEPTVLVPFPMTLQPATGDSPRSLTITSEGPIDVPLVILTD